VKRTISIVLFWIEGFIKDRGLKFIIRTI